MELEINNVIRDWFYPQERGYGAISFTLKNKPESQILLTQDSEYNNMFDFHPINCEDLEDIELDFLVSGIVSYIPRGWTLGTCGESYEQKLRFYRKLYGKLSDTDCVRILHDSFDKHSVYLKILRKD